MEKELTIVKTRMASGLEVWQVIIFNNEDDTRIGISCMSEDEANLIAHSITDNSIDVIMKI